MRGSIHARDLDDAIAALSQLAGDLPGRALADALNHTANQARQALRVEMEDVFTDPTPWVLNSIYMKSATAKAPEAALWVKDGKLGGKGRGFDEWFSPQVFGGNRLVKGSEKMLRGIGVLRPGQFIVPTAATPLDANGGISRGWMNQLLSGLQAYNLSGSDHNATRSARSKAKRHGQAFFVIKRGKVPIGIGERRNWGEGTRNSFQVVLLFSRAKPAYRSRFNFFEIIRTRFAENDELVESNINKAIADALNGRLPSSSRRRSQATPRR